MSITIPIKRALDAVKAGQHVDRDKLEVAKLALRNALAAAQRADRNSTLTGAIPEDMNLALALTAMHEHLEQVGGAKFEMVGVDKYEDLDPGWIGSLVHRILDSRVDFPTHTQQHVTPVVDIGERATLALAGDWGTGNPSSRAIATQIAALRPDHTIHLGDVYYSGTESEEREKMLGSWPAGTNAAAPSFALNGNHEMYSGGSAYFEIVLGNAQFKAQRGLSYFALQNANWTLIGLDSAYAAKDYLYQHGDLGVDDSPQVVWLRATVEKARTHGKRIVLLTHHQGLDIDPERNVVTYEERFWNQVRNAFGGGGPDFWYWGHVHAGIAYKPIAVGGTQVRLRCVGHGGVPYAPFPAPETLGDKGVGVVWAETEQAGDPDEHRRALNGFVTLALDGPHLTESFHDEHGNVRNTIVW